MRAQNGMDKAIKNQQARRDTFTAVSLVVDIDGHIMSVHVFTGSSLSTHLCNDVVF